MIRSMVINLAYAPALIAGAREKRKGIAAVTKSKVKRFLVFLLAGILLAGFPTVYANEKPLLSDEIRKVIEMEGVEAAKKRFAELYPAQKDRYRIGIQDLFNLGSEYMQKNDLETAMVVMEMNSAIVQAQAMSYSYGQQLNDPGMAEVMQQVEAAQQAAKPQREQERRQEQKRQEAVAAQHRGKTREDLARFTGIYVDPKTRDKKRALWVMTSCDGYLVSGATWGDVSPWWMRSAADKVFTYSDAYQSFSIEFETAVDGEGRQIIHDLNFLPSPLEKAGPVPSDWGSCMENRLQEQHG